MDWNDPATWPQALDRVTSVYVAFYPDITVPGAVEIIESFARQAQLAGVRRIVLLSGRGEEEAEAAERAIARCGIDWTVVRASWISQNFSEAFLLPPVLSGEIAMPAGDVTEPFVDADDIADVAVAALTDAAHAGQIYEVTGPRLLSFADAASEIAKASGRPVVYVPVTSDEYAAGAVAQGIPVEFVEPLVELFARVLDGRNSHTTDGVQRALGRPPRAFSEYATAAAATGIWNPSNHGVH
jgi:uncharacterized protein YbjT (DUF2867 family)